MWFAVLVACAFLIGGVSLAWPRRFTVRWTFTLDGERWRLERVAQGLTS